MSANPAVPISSAAPVTGAAPKKTVSPRHALLEQLIGLATRYAGDQWLDLATRLAGALIDATDGDTRAMQQRIRAGNMLRNGRHAFLHLARTALERALRRELAQLAPVVQAVSRTPEPPLALVPYEEMDSKVALGGISKPFEVQYGDRLQTLNVRLAFLLDRDILRLSQNPFRPDVFLQALQQAWDEFDPEKESGHLLQPLLKPGMFIELGPMLDAMNLALQRDGGVPDRQRARKADGASTGATRAQEQQAALARQLRQFFAASDVVGQVADDIAGRLAGDIDLHIPDLPQSALASGNAWAPAAGARGVLQARPGPGVGAGHGHAGGFADAGVAAAGVQRYMGGFVPAGESGPVMAAPGFAAGDTAFTTVPFQPGRAIARQPLLSYLASLQQGGPGEAPRAGSSGPSTTPAAGPSASATPATPTTSAKVFYLPSIKENLPQGSLSRADESTIDLLGAIFDAVFRDQNISQEIRDLIRFLQIPVLKAALVDKDFFFQEAHPARRLIDLLSRMGWEQRKGPDDPLFQAMQRSVDRVGRDASHELAVFTEAVDELEASLRADEQVATAAMAAPIAAALKQEKLAEAGKSARNAVAVRIGTGEVIAVLEAFLEQRWVSVLTIAYSVESEKPGAVDNATRTMDELIWSVKPKLAADERKRLITRLPKLLASLNRWLDVIKWQDADRLQFFAELAECHASIVRAPLDLTPERQLEISLQVAQQAAERRMALQAAAQADPPEQAEQPKRVDQPGQAEPPPDHPEPSVQPLDTLVRGMWLSFAGRDKVKLAWISPLRTLFIFSTPARQEAFSIAAEALDAQLRDGTAQVLRADGVVAVALSAALAGTAVNDAAPMRA